MQNAYIDDNQLSQLKMFCIVLNENNLFKIFVNFNWFYVSKKLYIYTEFRFLSCLFMFSFKFHRHVTFLFIRFEFEKLIEYTRDHPHLCAILGLFRLFATSSDCITCLILTCFHFAEKHNF